MAKGRERGKKRDGVHLLRVDVHVLGLRTQRYELRENRARGINISSRAVEACASLRFKSRRGFAGYRGRVDVDREGVDGGSISCSRAA